MRLPDWLLRNKPSHLSLWSVSIEIQLLVVLDLAVQPLALLELIFILGMVGHIKVDIFEGVAGALDCVCDSGAQYFLFIW